MQLNLFGDSRPTILRNEIAEALESLDLSAAVARTTAFLAEYPRDDEAPGLLAAARRWHRQLGDFVDAGDEGRFFRLFQAFSPDDPPPLRLALRDRLIDELRRHPQAATLYHPPHFHLGLLLLARGDYVEAEGWLEQALVDASLPVGRFLARRGDALWLQGKAKAARKLYLKAFLEDAQTVAMEELCDGELLGLWRDAESEQGEGSAAHWLPALGVLTGLFACDLTDIAADPDTFGTDLMLGEAAGPREWFERLRYAEYLRRTNPRHPHLIAVRRQLKDGHGLLFARYMAFLQSAVP